MSLGAQQTAGVALPESPTKPVVETLHGVDIVDPYRWLEDGESEEGRAWTEEQNAHTRRLLDSRPERPVIRERLAQLLHTGFVEAPVLKGDRYFYTSRMGDEDQPKLYVRDDGADRVLVDPAGLRDDATVALDWWYPSPDGSLVAYGLSEGGDELSTLYVLDVAGGELLADTIDRTRFCSVAWLPDSSGFYYTRYPAPGTVPLAEERYHRNVFLHHLGADPGRDPLIYADPDPQAIPELYLSIDGRYLLIQSYHGWSKVTLLWRDLHAPGTEFTDLSEGLEAILTCEEAQGSLYIHTNWDAPKYRVFKAPLAAPVRSNWQEIIPEGPHALQTLKVAGSWLVGETLENALSHLRLFDLDGQPRGEVALPAAGTVYGPASSHDKDEVLFAFTSFAYPLSAYRYWPRESRLELFRAPQTPVGVDPDGVAVRQVWYPSKDGTPISMFVVHRSVLELDGQRPTLLTGYGGFNVSRTPEFEAGLHLWIERGGAYALPNLRGGGEYGETWHQAGMLGNKQNVFDDFIAAAEWLVVNGYTTPRKLACWGGSNGGLLVGAAITQRPDLFGAAVCAVPLLDMLRYHLFQIARLWIPEYGSSEDPAQFRWLYAYSPYHHVQQGVDYPATLLMTGEGDSRVDPLHARKMAALLQASTAGDRPILLRTESRAGHGQGKPVTKLVEERADAWTFVAWQLGLTVA
jgi:prolyl oligopeptidase